MIRRLSVLIMSVGLSTALVLAPTASSADETTPNPVVKTLQKVKTLVSPKNVQAAVDAPEPPASDDDIPPNETENPVGPDHATTRGLSAFALNQGLIGLNHNNATVNDDDTTTAHSSALNALGLELFPASASSGGTNYERNEPLGVVLDVVCAITANNVCVDALYSEAHATEDATSSHAHAESGILNACIGGGGLPQLPGGSLRSPALMVGQSEEPPSACDGLLGAGVGLSRAEVNRDRVTGQTTSEAYDTTIGACVLPGCVIPVAVLDSFGQADSGTTPGTEFSDRGSFLIALGEDQFFLIDEPEGFALDGILGLFFNQGESYLGNLLAGTAQDGLKLFLLTDLLPIFAEAGHTETLAHNDGRLVADDTDTTDEDRRDGRDRRDG